jgi:hypothetical protein
LLVTEVLERERESFPRYGREREREIVLDIV